MKSWISVVPAVMVLMTTACSTFDPADESAGKSAVDYNRAFARSRDEITVLNILRASERQPLQFSTISSVQGGLKTATSVKIPFTNIIAGGANSISPEVTITARNPVVSIVPLATKEFIQGISRPIEPDLIDALLAQGWKKEVVLPLVVGGVVCPHQADDHKDEAADFIKVNDGDNIDEDVAFRRVLTGRNTFTLTAPPTLATLRVTSKEALRALKEGVGTNRSIESVTPIVSDASGPEQVLVKVVKPGKVQIAGLDFSPICGSASTATPSEHAGMQGDVRAERRGVILRSVLSMFRYLGQAQAFATRRQLELCKKQLPNEIEPGLFTVRVACRSQDIPEHNVVSTTFQGHTFYIAPSDEAGAEDHTLEMLSLLSYLVGLQTSEASLRGTTPFVTITQ